MTPSPSARRAFLLAAAAVMFCHAGRSQAQILARPGWAGSGISADVWWKNAIFYQIDPLSFQDSNGDGFGDLKGITDRLDYLQALGVDAIVLSPLQPRAQGSTPSSMQGPQATAKQAFDPAYGTDDDLDHLVQEASGRKMRVLVDLPLSGAQTIDALSGAARYWLSRGVAGLRLVRDAGDQGAGVAALTPYQVGDRIRELRHVAASFAGQRILLGDLGAESPATPVTPVVGPVTNAPAPTATATHRRRRAGTASGSAPASSSDAGDSTQLPTQPQLQIDTHIAELSALRGGDLRVALALATQTLHGPAPVTVVASDTAGRQRSLDRFGDGQHDVALARILATVVLTNRSAAMLYFGQEIGMVTTPAVPAGQGLGHGGDPTPMQWGKPGFTTGTPWLDPGPNAATANVQAEEADPQSLLHWYRQLTALHHGNPTLREGSTTILQTANPEVVAWARRSPRGDAPPIVIVCNLSASEVKLSLKDELARNQMRGFYFHTLLRSGVDAIVAGPASLDALTLPPFGVFIGEVHR